MSKEATIIQSFNDVKQQYEYFVKGYDVTESVKILLKRHKEEYDKEKKIFAGIDGYLEAQKEYQSQIADLEAKLAESEKKVKHWHNLYNERDKQFQSVRQRYHLLNKLQSNYDKKDKLHLAYMQCAELVDENEQLKQQLAEKDKELAYMTEQAKKFNNEAQKYFEDAYCNDFHKRDKITFAIEQLENVKEFVNDFYGEYSASVTTNFIDNQIKQLKH